MRIDENFDKLSKKADEFEKKEFPMGIGIIMQEGITNTLIKFGNEILEDCKKEKEKLQEENILLKNKIHELTCEFKNKWHNLKENLNDLPKDNSLKQIYLGKNNYERAWYNKNENQWIVENDECCFYEHVEQWCDLPRL